MGYWLFSLLIFLCVYLSPNLGRVLSPPLFNLAENRRIVATSTCGEINGEPKRERYCFLAGATAYSPFAGFSYGNDFAELRISSSPTNENNEPKSEVEGGQSCHYCDSSVPEISHPASNMVDGSPRWWQSPPLSRGMEYNEVNISIDLEQEFHVAYVTIIMANSPRPGLWVLERSTDYGKTYHPWQYFAEHAAQCEEFFGPESLQPILDDDSVICSTEYSQIVPLENGQIFVTLLNNRPNRGNFSHSEKLQKFTEATNVRIRLLRTKTLQGHLMDLNDKKDPTITRRYFYAIKEIEMGGRCVCNGHAETCDILDQMRPNRLLCRCEHDTCGDQCEKCCPGYEQKKWQPTREMQVFRCEPCNCHGHSEECEYDEDVDKNHQSLDINGKYDGGGVCKNCRDNTDGINCEKCVFGFFRPYDRQPNATNACEACQCHPHYHTGACQMGTGQCECRPNFEPPDCRSCAKGYYDYPECKLCDCHVDGTLSEICLPENGTCPCKNNYGGTLCDSCVDGFYQFPDCLECQCEDLGAVSKNCTKDTGHCQCKINYGGKNCELCADGYFRHPSCQYCDCDHSGTEKQVCDKVSGQCHCKAGYAGDRCDKCADSFYGYPDCKPCNCDSVGSLSSTCHSTHGQCQCKANFTGKTCNRCSAGYYDYPKCLSCNCDRWGSYGITCNDNGLCFCKSNFDGGKCDKCKTNFYNYPTCEECNCDPRGVSHDFGGCDKVPIGELCSCKARVTGRICNECKPTFWNLQFYNPLGCEDCGCNLSGTLSGLSDCDDITGQCKCKAHAAGRNCVECKAGFYNLQAWNYFGCEPCNCDIGGSYSSICDEKTGQCRCKPRISGRNCTEPIDMHYFPTLGHMQYEAEDGRTPDNRAVRYAIDETLFANFSWRGFAVFSPIQDEILLTVDISKPSVYRLIFHYVNPTANDLAIGVEFQPTYTYSQQDAVKQEVDAKLAPTSDPKSSYISKNGSPFPFVLYPGRWTLHIKTKQRLLLDYVTLIPSAYFEGSLLRQDVRNPCLLHKERLANGKVPQCKQYNYPKIPYTKTPADAVFYDKDGAKKTAPPYPDDVLSASHGPTALLDKPTTYYAEVSMEKPGNYVVVIDYANFLEEFFPVNVKVGTEVDNGTGAAIFHHCPYSELCREVISKDGQPLVVLSDGRPAKISITPADNISIALAGIVAIPQPNWTVDYLLPKYRCVMKNEKCDGSEFLTPPNTLQYDVESQSDPRVVVDPQNLPFEVADLSTRLVPLNQTNNMIEIRGNVTVPDHYVIAVHYYNPDSAISDLDVIVQADRDIDNEGSTSANAHLPLSYCPSVSGCRSTILRRPDDAKTFEIRRNFALKFFPQNPDQTVYLDYVLPIQLNSYADDVLEPITSQRSTEFLTKCSNLLLKNEPSEYDESCKLHVFSLTADYNGGVSACDCNGDGSTSFLCQPFGGQCPCKPNVIGRQCSMCQPGYYGFPDCRPCNCQRSQQCDAGSGQCICPLHVEGQQCDRCKPYAFGYDSLIGCQECECNTHGTKDGTLKCDQLLGQCKCKDNVGGRKCDKCLPGFYGFPYCYKCSCELAGSEPEICNQNTAQCTCKENVVGHACESCNQGTFFLEERNPKGCTDCFCFGITSQCRSSDFVKIAIMDMKNWTAANVTELKEGQDSVEYAPEESSDSRPRSIYFSAPQSYLGKMLFSYGGKLIYYMSSQPMDASNGRSMTADVILQGQNETLEYWADELPADPKEEFRMVVDITPEKWRRSNGAFVTRPLLMSVLNRLSALLIKGSYYDQTSKAKLSRVTLDSASPELNQVGETAANVEICSCPAGYAGFSCEECDDGYYRIHGQSIGSTFLGSCVPCQCNGHSQKCDKATGQCFDCQHETRGDRCEICSAGHYGDPTRNQPTDCRVCPCPHATMQNNFANSCIVDDSGLLHSCQCRPGYTGLNCGSCATGWFGDPMTLGDFCHPCSCNENNNLTVPGACDPLTGVCSLCQSHTMGNACEMCESWYYGDAVEAKNCSECSCNRCGSHHCDHVTGTCHCKQNVEGETCDKCVPDAFGFNSCYGCTMCQCAEASVSTQCEAETGLCTCQPGVVGQRCDKCEQGYWNYKATGCTKCDCEADLSLGTVCDVLTGQCHCMDGATGPRCDQCIEGYLRIPEHGCRYCDQCAHFLVNDLYVFDKRMDQLNNELNNVSFVYLTRKRLDRINASISDLEATFSPLLQNSTEDAIREVQEAVIKLRSTADDLAIKAKRSEVGSNKTNEKLSRLEDETSLFNREIHQQVVKARDLVQNLFDLADGLYQGSTNNQKREMLVEEAHRALEEIKSINLSPIEANVMDEYTEAEKVLNDTIIRTQNETEAKKRANETLQRIESLHSKLADLDRNLINMSNRALEADQYNDLTQKHPYYVRGITFDSQLASCQYRLDNATDLLAKSRTSLLDSHDFIMDVREQEAGLSQMFQNISLTAFFVREGLVYFDSARQNAYNRVQELEDSSSKILGRFDGVRSDSHRAVQAADSYRNMATAITDAQTASENAKNKATDAETNSHGIAEKSKESNVASMELLRSATKNRATVINELRNNLTMAKSRMESINETVQNDLNAWNDISNELVRFNGGKNALAASNVVEDSKKMQEAAKTLNNQLADIVQELPKLQDKARGGVSSAVDIQQDIKGATAQIESLNDVIPKALDGYANAYSMMKARVDSLKNISFMLEGLRDKVLKARDLANRIKVGTTFTPDSSLQLYNPDKFSRTSAHTSISFFFKTKEPKGLLMFLGNEVGTARPRAVQSDDYLAVEVEGGKAKLTYDLGSGDASIYSNKIVSDDRWHKLTIDRTGKQATLSITDENGVVDRSEGFSPGPKSVLNVHQNLSKFYVGGVPGAAKMPTTVNNRHFTGQIEDLVFHGQRLGLWNFALNGSVQAQPAAARSEMRVDSADTGIRLNGEGYVEMSRNSWNPRKEANVRFSFKTFSPSGLLFYIGKDKDYVAVEIRNGKVLAQFNLGSGVAQLTTPKNYDDGAWHSVEFSRNGKAGKLIMDMDTENPVTANAPGLLANLDVIDAYYIGGLKNPIPQNEVTKQSFYGCIDKFKLNDHVINLANYRSAAFVEVGCPDKAVRVVSFDESAGGLESPQIANGQSIEITFKFKTRQRDALILLLIDETQANVFSVTLESGALVLSTFSNGQMSRLKMDYRDLADEAWHFITATRDNKNIKMDVDDIYSETGELKFVPSPGGKTITLYFGKVPEGKPLSLDLASRAKPFVGCIGDVMFNKKLIDFTNATRSATGVSYVGCPLADPIGPPATDDQSIDNDDNGEITQSPENSSALNFIRPLPPLLDDACVLANAPAKNSLATMDLAGSRFGISPNSRLEFDKLPEAFDTRSEFSIQFRATASSGLLFYAANRVQSDFIALYMKNGHLIFSFDSGTGSFSLQSKRRYLDFHWHTVVACRDDKHANISVDGIVEAKGEYPGATYAIDTHRPFYVGGVAPDVLSLARKSLTGASTTFGGCLRDFRLNGAQLIDPASSHGTKPCSELAEIGLYFGPQGGYAILQDELYIGPTFSFEMEIKPRIKDAVLLSIAASNNGDYLTLQLLDGTLKFTVDNGAGPQTVNLSLQQSETICDGHWHSIKIYKTKNLLTISVDGTSRFFVIRQVKSTDTNTRDPLYLGGVPHSHVNRGLQTRDPFFGCIRDVNIGKKPRRKKHLDVSQIAIFGDIRREGCPVY